jgi:hypothetical protein
MPPINLPNYTSAVSEVKYAIASTGNVMFNATIGSSDSPDYSEAGVTGTSGEGNTQCVILSPAATPRVA